MTDEKLLTLSLMSQRINTLKDLLRRADYFIENKENDTTGNPILAWIDTRFIDLVNYKAKIIQDLIVAEREYESGTSISPVQQAKITCLDKINEAIREFETSSGTVVTNVTAVTKTIESQVRNIPAVISREIKLHVWGE